MIFFFFFFAKIIRYVHLKEFLCLTCDFCFVLLLLYNLFIIFSFAWWVILIVLLYILSGVLSLAVH